MFGRDRLVRLEGPVAGVLPALDVLERVRGAPKGMEAVSVLVDVDRRAGSGRVHKLTFFFTRRGKKDAVCQFDNGALTLICSSPYPSPPKPGGWEALDLGAVRVDLEEALDAAVRTVGVAVTERPPPELLVDALLKSVEGRPCWEMSYDVWLEEGPDSFRRVRVDAVTGEVALVGSDGG